jgi:2-hydroxy-3-keto-5-methylthiopentenyl-1-phosphate phosphatase
MRVAVATDGFGFYVEPMLRAAGVEGVKLFANDVGVEDEPKRFAFPFAHPVCVGCGTCKMAIVRRYRVDLGTVAFVGEGHTDRYGALYSDVVFAKKALVEICRADGVPFIPWEDFDDVRDALATLDRLPGAVDPARCPGWKEP